MNLHKAAVAQNAGLLQHFAQNAGHRGLAGSGAAHKAHMDAGRAHAVLPGVHDLLHHGVQLAAHVFQPIQPGQHLGGGGRGLGGHKAAHLVGLNQRVGQAVAAVVQQLAVNHLVGHLAQGVHAVKMAIALFGQNALLQQAVGVLVQREAVLFQKSPTDGHQLLHGVGVQHHRPHKAQVRQVQQGSLQHPLLHIGDVKGEDPPVLLLHQLHQPAAERGFAGVAHPLADVQTDERLHAGGRHGQRRLFQALLAPGVGEGSLGEAVLGAAGLEQLAGV